MKSIGTAIKVQLLRDEGFSGRDIINAVKAGEFEDYVKEALNDRQEGEA